MKNECGYRNLVKKMRETLEYNRKKTSSSCTQMEKCSKKCDDFFSVFFSLLAFFSTFVNTIV